MFETKEFLTDEELAVTTAAKLSKDLKIASSKLGKDEGRFLVQQYYTAQENRISAQNQARKLQELDKPYELIKYVYEQMALIESQIKNSLDIWTMGQKVGVWLRSIKGIGPVIAAGLIAHLDIEKAPTAGAFMRFAGIDPTCKWNKGEKRPYNATLKTLLVYKTIESFVKVQNRENDIYGHIFAVYKKMITANNNAMLYASRAKELLATRKYNKDTETYKVMTTGLLCKAHVHAMARRKVAKLFISHLHEIMYWDKYGKCAPLPYPIVHLATAHPHYFDVPNMEQFPGMQEARHESLKAIGKMLRVNSASKLGMVLNGEVEGLEDVEADVET